MYSSNYSFLQEQKVSRNSAKHFLTVTIKPVQCNVKAAGENGVSKSIPKIWKSEAGVSIQWEEGRHKNDWVFYQAIYDSPGCD